MSLTVLGVCEKDTASLAVCSMQDLRVATGDLALQDQMETTYMGIERHYSK